LDYTRERTDILAFIGVDYVLIDDHLPENKEVYVTEYKDFISWKIAPKIFIFIIESTPKTCS
jgi:hypothetical protein